MNNRFVIASLFACAAWNVLPAQVRDTSETNPRSAQVALITRTDRDSVVLRWAPTKPGGWLVGNRFGYHVERVRLNRDGSFNRRAYERLTPAPLRPWSQEQWLQRTPRDNKFAPIALQALHGKAFIPRPTGEGEMSALRNAADELSNRYGFSLLAADNDAVAAEGLGLRIVDRNVKDGDRLIYRVFVAGIDSSYALDTAYAIVEVRGFQPPPAPQDLSAEGQDGRIALRWTDPPVSGYSGYYVFRSEDKGKTYKKLNEFPFANVTPEQAKGQGIPRFLDTTIVNYKMYRYALRGVTPFAELSAAAEIDAYGRDLRGPGSPETQNPVQLDARRVKIEWTIKDPDPDLAGFIIGKSNSSMGGYRELLKRPLPKTARQFIDSTANEEEAYYIVGAIDTAGNVSPSLPVYAVIIDSVPPGIPRGLRGRIDSLGVVRLTWNFGPEPDILGYRVLRANDPTHEFAQRTPAPWKDTTFVDTVNIKTLTRYVYYRIAAVDKRYNHSELSAMLAIKRPDRIAPEAPVFLDTFVTDSLVRLTWAPSTSEDVRAQILYRKRAADKQWQSLATLRPSERMYTDRAVVQGTMYQYQIEAVDSAGYRSGFAMAVQGRPYDPGTRAGIDSLRAAYNQRSGSITLRWTYRNPPKENYWFVVYKGTGEYSLAQYRSVEQKVLSFEDKSLNGKGTYRYAVKVMTSKGGESRLSTPVTVVVQ